MRGSPPSTEICGLPADERAPGWKAGWICGYVVFLLRDSASSGAGAGGAGRLGSPGPGSLWGAPRGVPPPSQESWCRGRQEGFFFLPQERSSLRQGGEGAGGGGPGSSLPHGRCLTGSPKSPGDYGTGSRPLGAAEGGPAGLTGARGPAAAAPRSSPSPAARLLGSRQASFPLM